MRNGVHMVAIFDRQRASPWIIWRRSALLAHQDRRGAPLRLGLRGTRGTGGAPLPGGPRGRVPGSGTGGLLLHVSSRLLEDRLLHLTLVLLPAMLPATRRVSSLLLAPRNASFPSRLPHGTPSWFFLETLAGPYRLEGTTLADRLASRNFRHAWLPRPRLFRPPVLRGRTATSGLRSEDRCFRGRPST